jgi:NhaA family Na+:H+ antiporter
MVVPASIYVAFNWGGPGGSGWAIPMATDIAFALGVLALAGSRAPLGLKVFVSALAIADDIGAVLVIALFYTESVAWDAVGVAGLVFVAGIAAGRLGVRTPLFYAVLGLAIWLATFASGLHASLAGIVAALMIPTRTRIHRDEFVARARAFLHEFESAGLQGGSMLSNEGQRVALENLEVDVERAQSPLTRLERLLHPWVAFAIIPLFALANAGVDVTAASRGLSPVSLGVAFGLAIGKPIGIVAFSLLAIRLGRASLPTGVTSRHIVGAGFLAGIGFTMSLFIASLAFSGSLLVEAKMGILAGSTCSGVIGLAILRRAPQATGLEESWEDDP